MLVTATTTATWRTQSLTLKPKDNDVTKVTFLDAGVAGIFSLGTGPLDACEQSFCPTQLAAATITGKLRGL